MIEARFRALLGVPTLRLFLTEVTSSVRHEELRRSLRQEAVRLLEENGQPLSTEQQARAQDLDHPFTGVGLRGVSISHSPRRAGVLYAPRACGFDIEQIARVKPAIVARVSFPDEVSAAPSPAFLWAAKEAAFKALARFQSPKLVSQIRIGDWKLLPNEKSQCGTFRLLNAAEFHAPEGAGVALEDDGEILCAFVFSDQTTEI